MMSVEKTEPNQYVDIVRLVLFGEYKHLGILRQHSELNSQESYASSLQNTRIFN